MISNGAIWAPIFLALEPRIKTGILLLGGLLVMQLREVSMPPEIDGLNYASRVNLLPPLAIRHRRQYHAAAFAALLVRDDAHRAVVEHGSDVRLMAVSREQRCCAPRTAARGPARPAA